MTVMLIIHAVAATIFALEGKWATVVWIAIATIYGVGAWL